METDALHLEALAEPTVLLGLAVLGGLIYFVGKKAREIFNGI